MRYFAEIETLGELKKEFRRLALENHPDHGGDACVMREIICEYKLLAKILPDVEPASAGAAAESPQAPEKPRFYCAYRPATAGGANPHLARLAKPIYSHKELCTMAKTLFVYGRRMRDGCDYFSGIKEFYWELCRMIDAGQARPYCDYLFSRKIAAESLKFIRKKVFNRIWKKEIWQMVKTAEQTLG